MTLALRQKLGRLLIAGFEGPSITPSHPIARDLSRNRLGGVILFDRLLARSSDTNNIVDPDQVKTLTEQIQDLGDGEVLICVDQEGGRVNRFKRQRGFPITPSPAELCQGGRRATATAAQQTAVMLKSCGINWNLAPVVDLEQNPNNPIIGRLGRSFSDQPDQVVIHAKEWIAAHRNAGILTCLKHFPGHGSSVADSHLGFVDITTTWKRDELLPFEKLISLHAADTIMIGHLFHKGLDPQLPATLSARVMGNLLREDLCYQGPIVSDDMQMAAITSRYSLVDACTMAIEAGADLVIVGNNLSHAPQIVSHLLDGLEQAAAAGKISEKRIEEALQKRPVPPVSGAA